MYYCDTCAADKEWPKSLAKSIGRCECCGQQRICNDRASKDLPVAKQAPGRAMNNVNISTSRWEAAADAATKAGHRPGGHAWWQAIRATLGIPQPGQTQEHSNVHRVHP